MYTNSTSVSGGAGTSQSNSPTPDSLKGLVLRACQVSAKLSFTALRESTKQQTRLQAPLASNLVTLQQSQTQLLVLSWSTRRDKGQLQELGSHQAGAALAAGRAGGSHTLSHPMEGRRLEGLMVSVLTGLMLCTCPSRHSAGSAALQTPQALQESQKTKLIFSYLQQKRVGGGTLACTAFLGLVF